MKAERPREGRADLRILPFHDDWSNLSVDGALVGANIRIRAARPKTVTRGAPCPFRESNRMSSVGQAVTVIGAQPSSVRILVAEDDTDLRGTLSRNLVAAGHVVVGEVGTMIEALERARELVPDVLLFDAHLGPTKVVEAAHAIAHDSPNVAVVFLCGESEFSLAGDVGGTTAIAVLPSSSPAQVLDSTIRLAVCRARELRLAREEVAEVRQQLENRKAIERAKGILMRRTGLSEQEAYRILQRTSQDRSVPMVAVAREVLESEPAR